MGTLYLVATPIGNLEDITLRALRILGEVSLILAEDTRQTSKLLQHYNISNRIESFHEHNEDKMLPRVLQILENGDVALVSDAGTPLLNDPGYTLVREAIRSGYRVSPVPGPSAPLAALTASGLAVNAFAYLGYLPRKSSEREKVLRSVAELPYTLIFLETPHRLLASLEDIRQVLGERKIVIAREMTKIHEEFFRGTPSQAITHFQQQPPRGEITLLLSGKAPQSASSRWTREQLQHTIKNALNHGENPTRLARRLAEVTGWKRREVYNIIIETQKEEGDHDKSR